MCMRDTRLTHVRQGSVKLYLNDELIDTAAPNSPKGPATQSKSFSVQAGDVVKLKDDGDAVINLKSFTVACDEGIHI